uniref:Uncharacterized protein n=1 Tax=Physcomitrium patens TaxID=3218 RepID=A0A2K1JKE4_PHYPA|nr:hypothetical protein PHYPA_016857 [Physcomitrium patens]
MPSLSGLASDLYRKTTSACGARQLARERERESECARFTVEIVWRFPDLSCTHRSCQHDGSNEWSAINTSREQTECVLKRARGGSPSRGRRFRVGRGQGRWWGRGCQNSSDGLFYLHRASGSNAGCFSARPIPEPISSNRISAFQFCPEAHPTAAKLSSKFSRPRLAPWDISPQPDLYVSGCACVGLACGPPASALAPHSQSQKRANKFPHSSSTRCLLPTNNRMQPS